MGIKSSPHGCVKMQALAEEVVRGDPLLTSNPFHWDSVSLNLPGTPEYSPSLAWVAKFSSVTGKVANDMRTYVDDVRTTGGTQADCRRVCHRISTTFCFLGIQDALRKRSEVSQDAGTWTGSLVHTSEDAVTVLCTQEKWDRAKGIIKDLSAIMATSGVFEFKTLECHRGFLVYVSRTYPSIMPYLKGIHLTVDSWRPNRDEDRWHIAQQVEAHLMAGEDDVIPVAPNNTPPKQVTGVPRLHSDLEALRIFFSLPAPPRCFIRGKQVMTLVYGFGDASGAGFGSSFLTSNGISY
jgi:hypothetical protein